MSVDEKDHLRPREEHPLSVNVVLPPKRFESAGTHPFYSHLLFPAVVTRETVSDTIDKVWRSFPLNRSNVWLFAHDSASGMKNAAERLETEKGRDVLCLDGPGEGCAVISGAVTGWGAFGVPVPPLTPTVLQHAATCRRVTQSDAECSSANHVSSDRWGLLWL